MLQDGAACIGTAAKLHSPDPGASSQYPKMGVEGGWEMDSIVEGGGEGRVLENMKEI